MIAGNIGAVAFGLVIGWITYRTLIRNNSPVGLSDIATVLGAVGGGVVVAIFSNPQLFGLYSIGLAVGFFGYLALFHKLNPQETPGVMGGGGTTSQPPRI